MAIFTWKLCITYIPPTCGLQNSQRYCPISESESYPVKRTWLHITNNPSASLPRLSGLHTVANNESRLCSPVTSLPVSIVAPVSATQMSTAAQRAQRRAETDRAYDLQFRAATLVSHSSNYEHSRNQRCHYRVLSNTLLWVRHLLLLATILSLYSGASCY